MANCKVCACGEKIVFERRLGFPDKCPSCGRKLVDFLTYNEDDPRVEELMRETTGLESNNEAVAEPISDKGKVSKGYYLKLSNGKKISIPNDGGIIGRTELGAEELAEYPSVSRQHIRVTVRRNIGVLIEDISKYGTLVDGQRIVKNEPVRVADGSIVTLCNVDVELIVKEAEN